MDREYKRKKKEFIKHEFSKNEGFETMKHANKREHIEAER